MPDYTAGQASHWRRQSCPQRAATPCTGGECVRPALGSAQAPAPAFHGQNTRNTDRPLPHQKNHPGNRALPQTQHGMQCPSPPTVVWPARSALRRCPFPSILPRSGTCFWEARPSPCPDQGRAVPPRTGAVR